MTTKVFSNVVSFTEESPRARSGDHPLLDYAREIMLAKSNQLFATMFERVQDLLFNLADKAQDGQERIQYFDALRAIRLRRAAVEAQFSAALAAKLAGADRAEFTKKPASAQPPDEPAHLTEVSDEQLAELVTLSKMAERSTQLLRTELTAIEQQLNAALKNSSVDDVGAAFGPDMVCDAFRLAVLAIDPPLAGELRRILFTVFDRCVLKQLGTAYQDIGMRLAKRMESADSPAASPNTSRSHSYARGSKGVPPYQLSQVLAALHRWQDENHSNKFIETNHSGLRATLKRQLTETLSAQLGRPVALKAQHADAIDMAMTLIEQMVSNAALLEPMKMLLSQLTTPLIKVALAETELFAAESHPARRLLADLAHAATSWTARSDHSADPLYAQMQTIVTTLRDDTDLNITVFYELLESFDKFLTTMGLASTAPPEVSYATQQRVWAAIEQQITTQNIPQPVIDFLRGPWRAVLSKIAEEAGCNSTAWHTGLRAIEQLLWSISPKHSIGERKLCAKLIPRLLSDIDEGLAVIAWDHSKKNKFHAELEALHLTALRPGIPKQDHAPNQFTPVTRADDSGAEITLASAPQHTKHVDLAAESDQKVAALYQFANELPPGTWLDLTDDDFRESRAKLAWKDEILKTLTFVNRRFQVVAELHLNELADKFAEGKARVVEDVPLVDRALDALANKLSRR